MMDTPPGLRPARIANDILEVFIGNVTAVPDRRAVKTERVELTYGELGRLAASIARDLPDDLGGRSVLFHLPNSAVFLAAFYAVLSKGGVPTPLNFATPTTMVGPTATGVKAALLIAAETGSWNGPELALRDEIDVARRLAADGLPAAPFPARAPSPDEDAIHLFSGGTTGTPKRVRHTHRSVMEIVRRMEWCWPTRDGDVWLALAPFSHVWGLTMGVLNPQVARCSLILPDRYEPSRLLDLMETEKVSVFGGGPPAIYQGLMADGSIATRNLGALRVCPGGGAPFPLEVHERWTRFTGVRIVEAFGMTEIAPIAVNSDVHGPRIGSVGRAVPDTEFEIVDVESGARRMAPGESGEIRIRGPQMMLDYVDNPLETALTVRDGWVYSGDIGVMDADGYLTITDRKKDLIIHKGYNVFPRELEEVLIRHGAVTSVGVVGVADERAGEKIVACVTLSDEVGDDELRAHCARSLPAYKVPAEIRVLSELPLTMARKLDRVRLRRLAAES